MPLKSKHLVPVSSAHCISPRLAPNTIDTCSADRRFNCRPRVVYLAASPPQKSSNATRERSLRIEAAVSSECRIGGSAWSRRTFKMYAIRPYVKQNYKRCDDFVELHESANSDRAIADSSEAALVRLAHENARPSLVEQARRSEISDRPGSSDATEKVLSFHFGPQQCF